MPRRPLEPDDGRLRQQLAPFVPELTPRHLEVLIRLSRGLSRVELADEMGISVAAVDYHARAIRTRCGLGPRELVLKLMRSRLLQLQCRP